MYLKRINTDTGAQAASVKPRTAVEQEDAAHRDSQGLRGKGLG
jgi:hypothetical protein